MPSEFKQSETSYSQLYYPLNIANQFNFKIVFILSIILIATIGISLKSLIIIGLSTIPILLVIILLLIERKITNIANNVFKHISTQKKEKALALINENSKFLAKSNGSFFLKKLIENITEEIINKKSFITEESKILYESLTLFNPEQYIQFFINEFKKLFNYFTVDKFLDKDEEKCLTTFLYSFPLGDREKNRFNKYINFYIELREIEEQELKVINKCSFDIPEKNQCYYETEIKIFKEKIIKTQTINGTRYTTKSFVKDKVGTGIITKSYLQLITTGHQKIKLSNIFNIVIEDRDTNILAISVVNRKTAMFISTPNIMKFMIILKKAKEKI